jgi:hypothetical protein
METQPFERLAAFCALAAGVAAFGYSTAFVLYVDNSSRGSAYASSLLLLTGAVLSTAGFTGLYARLRETDAILDPKSGALLPFAVLSGSS